MDGLPFTSRRTSWFAGLVLAVLLYFIYYTFFFQTLLGSYKNYFTPGSFEKSKENLVVWVEVPRYYFNAGPSSLYVHVKNKGNEPVEQVNIYLVIKSPDSIAPSVPLPYVENDIINTNNYSNGVEFPLIAPGAIVTERITFITQSEATITGILLQVSGSNYEKLLVNKDISLGESSVKALQIEVLEHLLLPPWSNIFILTLVLLSIFLIHHKEKVSEIEPELFESLIIPNHVWWQIAFEDFVKSLLVLVAFAIIASLAFGLLGIIHAEILLPLTIVILFTPVVVYGWLHRENKKMTSFIVFLSFSIMICIALKVLLIWKDQGMLLSPNGVFDGVFVWALLFIEALVVFIWSRALTFSNPITQTNDSMDNEAKTSNSKNPAVVSGKKKNPRVSR